MEVDGATSVSTILLFDVDVESFSPYIYIYIYIYQPLRLNTPKLPYEKPLVWEISSVVN